MIMVPSQGMQKTELVKAFESAAGNYDVALIRDYDDSGIKVASQTGDSIGNASHTIDGEEVLQVVPTKIWDTDTEFDTEYPIADEVQEYINYWCNTTGPIELTD